MTVDGQQRTSLLRGLAFWSILFRHGSSDASDRPQSAISERLRFVDERLQAAAKRNIGSGRNAVTGGKRIHLERAGDQRGPEATCRGTRQRMRVIGLVSFGRARRDLDGLFGEGRDLVAQRRVGCEHAVIAMPGQRPSRGRNLCSAEPEFETFAPLVVYSS